MDEEMDDTITLNTGSVEYSAETARVSIDDMIALLENAKSEGATHAVLLSGNYRGAQFIMPPTGYDWLSELGS